MCIIDVDGKLVFYYTELLYVIISSYWFTVGMPNMMTLLSDLSEPSLICLLALSTLL